MISSKEVKLITSLRQKKYRNKYKSFVAEGIKTVRELLESGFAVQSVFSTRDFDFLPREQTRLITEAELKKISSLKTPNSILGVFDIPEESAVTHSGIQIVLDGIQDPGNLGTIIRLCDWFDVSELVCSNDTVDCYNPKVVQASMGSIARVSVRYTDVLQYIRSSPLPKFATLLEGENIFRTSLPDEALIVMGNEANGIRPDVKRLVKAALTIPQFGKYQRTESLNVATATAVVLSEFKRNSVR